MKPTLDNFDWTKWERDRKWINPDIIIVDYIDMIQPIFNKSKTKRQLEILIRKKKIKEILED